PSPRPLIRGSFDCSMSMLTPPQRPRAFLFRCRQQGRLPSALTLILSETDTAGPVTHPEYDPFLVRFYGALLVTMMAGRSRGESSMIAAWQEAIADDPLPNSRSAEAIAMRLLAMPLESNEDF
ncbi:hypothetical protein, partial [Sphingobium sp. WCS2017Hpa-17]|uniref:hypothetical protein n=1 Tax=Sphingobium sp. WCS2017Hpa-17 TaxID=3073638 RepID=UPI00288B7CC8